tara:strand:- start:1069 stop:1257 length:189 start_codon:yes stop_codon:yes gene_type:complete
MLNFISYFWTFVNWAVGMVVVAVFLSHMIHDFIIEIPVTALAVFISFVGCMCHAKITYILKG